MHKTKMEQMQHEDAKRAKAIIESGTQVANQMIVKALDEKSPALRSNRLAMLRIMAVEILANFALNETKRGDANALKAYSEAVSNDVAERALELTKLDKKGQLKKVRQ